MKYPYFDVYAYHTPMIQWAGDEAVVDCPIWRNEHDEFTDRKRFPTLKHAIQFVNKYLRVHHYLIHDGHKWHEIFLEVA